MWQADFPRIVEDIPRRLPHPDFPSLAQGLGLQLKELFVPGSVSGQEVFIWGCFLSVCVLLATVTELVSVANRTADRLKAKRAGEDEGEEDDEAVGLGLGPSMPEVPRTRASLRKLRRSRRLYAAEIRAERARGLQWLALITVLTVWCTGILTRDNALSP